MLQKHIRAVSLVLTLCLIAVMFVIVAVMGSTGYGAAGTVAEVVLLLFVAAAWVSVFAAHEKHD